METSNYQISSTHEGIIKLKGTIGENKRRAKGVYALTWFAEELEQLKGTEYSVQCGVVYGPFARGAKRVQQLDLLLVLENDVDEDVAMEFIVEKIICKIYMEVRIFFYLDVLNSESLKPAIESPTPLMMRILKEGTVFYGRDVLNAGEKECIGNSLNRTNRQLCGI
ncbi:hypothetical protein HYR99_41610 [Candidatus Poribacteria bacterium]|nr:hypothetical protein [Candidatus Poribacteria bacterium]